MPSNASAQKLTAQQEEKARVEKYLKLILLPDSLSAVLTVNGLEYGDEKYYKQYFQEIANRKIKNLIVDVRKNHGGDVRIISNLLSYLADSSFVMLSEIKAKMADPTLSKYAAYFDSQINSNHKLGYQQGRKQGEWFIIEPTQEMGKITGYLPKAEKNAFTGNLFVLIGGGTFSNAANFTTALKASRKGMVFIGSETGGTESGCGGGTNQQLTLPHSKIVLTMPLMRLVSASTNPKDGHGLMPDIEIIYTPQAVIQKQDLELEKALELIKSSTEK